MRNTHACQMGTATDRVAVRRDAVDRHPLAPVSVTGTLNRRPQLTIVAPGASPEEAAAVVAALEQFMRATAPIVLELAAAPSRWREAAVREGVSRRPDAPAPWA